jgi:hypothetical protein
VNATDGEPLCTGYNHQLQIGDPTEHGEINAIRVSLLDFDGMGTDDSIELRGKVYRAGMESCPGEYSARG